MPFYLIYFQPDHRPQPKTFFLTIEHPAATVNELRATILRAGTEGLELTVVNTTASLDGSYRLINFRHTERFRAEQIEMVKPAMLRHVDRKAEGKHAAE